MPVNLRNLLVVTFMAAVGFYVLKATQSFVPVAPYRTFISSI